MSTGQVITSKKRNVLLLIDPYPEDNPYRMIDKEQRSIWFPKLSLPVIASRTPDSWEVRMIDESRSVVKKDFINEIVREVGTNNLFVGLSTQMTCYTPRAYEISDQFRARGVKVVLGGTHATYLPDEAIRHADAVVKFEADEIWPEVIRDFEKDSLKPIYEMTSYPELDHDYPFPRIDLLPKNCYMTNQCIQTTRGCHFECEFCSVSPFNGKSSRRRTVDDVIAEIQHVMAYRRSELVGEMTSGPIWHRIGAGLRILMGFNDGSFFAFVDDLHNSNRDYCKKLWTALKELKIRWGAQCTLFLGDEPDMVKLAAESGCVAMFVGMESINQEVLADMKKPFNHEKQFEKQIQCFHDHGIMVNPGVIFGSDGDDESVFENTVEFLIKCNVELAYINIVTPLPGTVLFDRMRAEGRIIDQNWANYDGKHVVFQPKQMSPEVLQEGFFWANRKFFSLPSILTRVSSTSQRFLTRWVMNWRFRHLILRTTPKGGLSPLSPIINKLRCQIPSIDTGNFIPNTLNAMKTSIQKTSAQKDQFLKIKVKRHEGLTTLLVDLEGTLDRFNVKEVRKRVVEAAKNARMDIVINLEHLKYAAPEALHTLLEWTALPSIVPAVRVKVLNLKSSFQEAFSTPLPIMPEMSEEKLRP